MRIAVLSDIHANLPALEAVRADLTDVDQVWVLGDIVGYGPQPNEVIATLQEMGARSVLGNHDGAAIGIVDPAYFNPDARAAIEWTAGALDDNARSYLATLPEVRRDGELTAVHGSPRDPIWEYIASRVDRGGELRLVRDAALPVRPHPPSDRLPRGRRRGRRGPRPAGRCRATSAPIARCSTRAASASRATAFPMRPTRSSSWTAQPAAAACSFHRVGYDIDRTQRLMREAGLPARLVERLRYGR